MIQAFLQDLSFGDVSAGALVIAAIWMVFTGRLVPRRYYMELMADRDKWRLTAEKKDDQLTKLVDNSTLTLDILKASPLAVQDAKHPEAGDRP